MTEEPRTNATYVHDEHGRRLVPEIVPEPEKPKAPPKDKK